MKLPAACTLSILLLIQSNSTAQSFEGQWKGTSICQVQHSPCHDEVVVYHISKDDTGSSYTVKANKVINNKEEEMGTLNFTFDDHRQSFLSVDSARGVKWEFKLAGNTMKGTLVFKGLLYRIVELIKDTR